MDLKKKVNTEISKAHIILCMDRPSTWHVACDQPCCVRAKKKVFTMPASCNVYIDDIYLEENSSISFMRKYVLHKFLHFIWVWDSNLPIAHITTALDTQPLNCILHIVCLLRPLAFPRFGLHERSLKNLGRGLLRGREFKHGPRFQRNIVKGMFIRWFNDRVLGWRYLWFVCLYWVNVSLTLTQGLGWSSSLDEVCLQCLLV